MKKLFFALFPLFLFLQYGEATDLSGSVSTTVVGGSYADPEFQILSVALSQDSVYSGTISSIDDSSKKISFDSETNSSGVTFYPFSAVGIFKPDVQIPYLTVSLTTGSNKVVSGISPTYHGGFKTTNTGFTEAPEIILEGAECNVTASVTATVNANGEITSITVDDGGTDYQATPTARIVAGPHFVRIIEDDHPHYGRIFLISDNNKTALTIELVNLQGGETTSDSLSTYLSTGTLIEVIPASTLGNTFGTEFSNANSNNLPSNWTTGGPNDGDWVYLWDVEHAGYMPYFFLDNSFEANGWGRGWYSKDSPALGIVNHTVIYPDQSILISKRTAGDVTFSFEGQIQDKTQSLYLPESANQSLVKNPYGVELLLSELIPSTSITKVAGDNNSSLFRAHTDADTSDGDYISFLPSDGNWKSFWYDASAGNTAISSMHELGVRRPTERSGTSGSFTYANASQIDDDDLLIAGGSISSIRSCDENGTVIASASGNDSNYTRLDIASTNSDLVGFTISLSNIQGHLLYEGGVYEANATTGSQVSNAGDGSIVDSLLNGSFTIIASDDVNATHDFVVIEKQRDINFRNDLGSPYWNVGKLGSGYDSSAKFYCIGGNNGTTDTNATGTISTGGVASVTVSGTGYSSSPQTIVSGGGWRLSTSPNARDDYLIGASEGILLQRNSSGGIRSYLTTMNPLD